MPLVAGVNGCRSGWLVILQDLRAFAEHLLVAPTFADALNQSAGAFVVWVDIPIAS